MPPVQVLLIDHNKLFREGLKLLLSGEKFEISGEAQTVAEGVTLVQGGLAPQLVLLDMTWNSDTETETLRTLRDLLPDGRVVVDDGAADPAEIVPLLDRQAPYRAHAVRRDLRARTSRAAPLSPRGRPRGLSACCGSGYPSLPA